MQSFWLWIPSIFECNESSTNGFGELFQKLVNNMWNYFFKAWKIIVSLLHSIVHLK